MTSAIRPQLGGQALAIADPVLRLHQTYCSIVLWCREPTLQQIVVCDGSGSADLLAPLSSYVAGVGKELEVLSFDLPPADIMTRGKGFGEGLIILHALKNSIALNDAHSFYKVTGRLHIANFPALQQPERARLPSFPCEIGWLSRIALGRAYPLLGDVQRIQELAREWWPGLSPGTHTWFWHCPKDYYLNYLVDSFRHVDDHGRLFLEHAMFVPLAMHGVRRFSPWPAVTGRSATKGRLYAGRDYPSEVKDLATQLMTSLGHSCRNLD
jgi:hypothetical protein